MSFVAMPRDALHPLPTVIDVSDTTQALELNSASILRAISLVRFMLCRYITTAEAGIRFSAVQGAEDVESNTRLCGIFIAGSRLISF
jgi:hypothetical protein